MSETWCQKCCTRHDLGPRCPGELLATDTERFGWRVVARSKQRTEEFGVLIAPCGELWRARILTFPNRLWSVPGGRATMKFAAHSALQAETKAREYIREFCERREYKIETHDKSARAPRLAAGPAGGTAQDPRQLDSIPVSFGAERPDRKGNTGNISKGGLFIETDRPFAQGQRLKILLEVGVARIPMSGTVAWARARTEGDRVAGMGVRLHGVPALYLHYVRELTGAEIESEAASEVETEAEIKTQSEAKLEELQPTSA
ncbi:MAG: hypothetical protein GY716_00590 [bacterium]|nr:hypothetical protein [bacterium]